VRTLIWETEVISSIGRWHGWNFQLHRRQDLRAAKFPDQLFHWSKYVTTDLESGRSLWDWVELKWFKQKGIREEKLELQNPASYGAGFIF
jgi:hypothetical protein